MSAPIQETEKALEREEEEQPAPKARPLPPPDPPELPPSLRASEKKEREVTDIATMAALVKENMQLLFSKLEHLARLEEERASREEERHQQHLAAMADLEDHRDLLREVIADADDARASLVQELENLKSITAAQIKMHEERQA